jgi:hypothetical protein
VRLRVARIAGNHVGSFEAAGRLTLAWAIGTSSGGRGAVLQHYYPSSTYAELAQDVSEDAAMAALQVVVIPGHVSMFQISLLPEQTLTLASLGLACTAPTTGGAFSIPHVGFGSSSSAVAPSGSRCLIGLGTFFIGLGSL